MSKSSLADTEGVVLIRPPQTEPPETQTGWLGLALAELVRYYRHSSVGRRCTGLVHNLNTPLQVISFQLELLEQKARDESLLLEEISSPHLRQMQELFDYRSQKLKQLHQEVEKLRHIIHLLTLQAMHEDQEEFRYLDLNQLLQEELALYQNDPFFKHQVEKEFQFDPAVPPIYGHYVDFSQSLRIFVDNALEAMAESPRRVLTVSTLLRENHRVVRIGDTGCGIPQAARPHLFEPFFTTKGTKDKPRAGLGLFMVRRLLGKYKADLFLESKAGETWVTVCLPITPVV